MPPKRKRGKASLTPKYIQQLARSSSSHCSSLTHSPLDVTDLNDSFQVSDNFQHVIGHGNNDHEVPIIVREEFINVIAPDNDHQHNIPVANTAPPVEPISITDDDNDFLINIIYSDNSFQLADRNQSIPIQHHNRPPVPIVVDDPYVNIIDSEESFLTSNIDSDDSLGVLGDEIKIPQFDERLHQIAANSPLTDIFIREMNKLHWNYCNVCDERDLSQINVQLPQCRRCRSARDPTNFSAINSMHPGHVPAVLKELTTIEQMLIAQVHPTVNAMRLPRGGQYGFKGHVCCFPQDVRGFVTNLPNLDIPLLVLRKQGANANLPAHYATVRRDRVLRALQWLQANNPFYHDIVISEENLLRLPVDGIFQVDNDHIIDEPIEEDEEVDNGPVQAEPLEAPPLSVGFCPVQIALPNERELIAAAINGHEQALQWPNVNRNAPIDEFRTHGYVARAFPHLFPTGKADINDPRLARITPLQYFRHMLRFRDGRFQDPRFVFLAYNTVARHQALNVGDVFVCRNPDEARLTMDELAQLVGDRHSTLSNRVLRYGQSLKGTPQYWYSNKQNLMSMIAQIGPPTCFWTFTFADSTAHDLGLFLPADLSRDTAISLCPDVVDDFCTKKWLIFLKHVFKVQFQVTDTWFRFEWQSRGSLHVHGLSWHEGAPNPLTSPPEVIVAYSDLMISCMNSAIADGADINNFFYRPPQDPTTVPLRDVCNWESFLKDVINKCQRHFRCTPYCLRLIQDEMKCKFDFPKQLRQATTVEFQVDENGVRTGMKLEHKRNDSIMNKHNPLCSALWCANTDMTMVMGFKDIAKYVAKYASKAEFSSRQMRETFRTIVAQVGAAPNGSFKKCVHKILMHTIGQRDISAQEACHLLSARNLYQSSRVNVNIFFNGLTVDEVAPGSGKVVQLTKYLQRQESAEMNQLSYFDFCRMYITSMRNGDYVHTRRNVDAIVCVSPYLKPLPLEATYEAYCMQRLFLHKPFRRWSDLIGGFESAVDAAFFEFDDTVDPMAALEDAIAEAAEDLAIQLTPDDARVSQVEQELWMDIMGDQRDITPLHLVQNQHAAHDWKASSHEMAPLARFALHFLIEAKANAILPDRVAQAHIGNLNPMQLKAYNIVLGHFQNNPGQPLRLLILGTAGTGKSYLLHCIRTLLADLCKVLTPTGVSALQVNGSTAHAFLALPVNRLLNDLRGDSLNSLQERCAHVNYFIFDECSMIGCKMLNAIDCRLRQAYPHNAETFFGNQSMIMFGDLGQLPPVMDHRLFNVGRSRSAKVLEGHAAYRTFTHSVVLRQSVRQQGDDVFKNLLLRLRNGQSTLQDFELLKTRFRDQVQEDFSDSVHLFTSTEKVLEHNIQSLQTLGNPVAQIEGVHNKPEAKQATSNVASGLHRFVTLAEGAKVMLRTNLWIEGGLVNGSMGRVVKIVYLTSDGPPAIPDFVLCTFNEYIGPPFCPEIPQSVPILPITKTWTPPGQNTILSRTNLPLSLAYGMTIHKSQGLTLDKVSVDLGATEQALGISFVALSRVRSLNDLLLEPFDFDRLKTIGQRDDLKERLTEEQRLNQLD